MQILDESSLEFELRCDNLEDLWVLSQFLVPLTIEFLLQLKEKVKIGNDKTNKLD